jgi:hypothetical protein
VFGFDLQFLLTGFADPAVLTFDEGVVMDSFTIVFGAEIAFHGKGFYRTS